MIGRTAWEVRVRGELGVKGILCEFCWGKDCLRGGFFFFFFCWGCFGEACFERFPFSVERWGAADCGEEGDFDGVCSAVIDCFSVEGLVWVQNFFACVSPLSLLFKVTDISISSGCSPSVGFFFFCFLFFLIKGDGGWLVVVIFFFFFFFFFFPPSIVVSVVIAVSRVVWCNCFCCCCYCCFWCCGLRVWFLFPGYRDGPRSYCYWWKPSFEGRSLLDDLAAY